MGLVVLGTVSSVEAARFSRDHGCDHPIVTAGRAPAAEVMRITNGRGVDYWIHRGDPPGLDEALACLARCGHCAVIDRPEGSPLSLEVDRLRERSLTVSAPVSFDYLGDRLYLQRLAHQVFAKTRSGAVVPVVERLPLSRAALAHQRIEAGQTMGATVLIPGS